MRIRELLVVGSLGVALALEAAGAEQAATQKQAADSALQAAIAGNWRTGEAKERDAARHPAEALTFWGLKPGMSILEIQPGARAWWTDILAPYARMTGGHFAATAADFGNPKLSESSRKGRADFEAKLAARPEVYGKVELINWGAKSAPLPANKFDFILTARSVHGWMDSDGGIVDKAFGEFYRALKPGGILALEQHRANPGPQDPAADNGYVTEAFIIETARKAGLELVGKSEINANPKDSKDHPFGVWTLPPTRTSVPYGENLPPDPRFDHSKYDAIGESDRMTLKFKKPG